MKNTKKGRPVDGERQAKQKNKLIEAGKSLLDNKPYSKITIRDIANEAQLNSAMIKYYFGSKENLFIAVVESLSAPLLDKLEKIESENRPLYEFIITLSDIISFNPAVVSILKEEVMFKLTPLSDAFINAFPGKVSELLPKLIMKETSIKDEVKANLAAFNLVSLIISPFLLDDIREGVWDINDDQISGKEWADYVYNLFINGIG
ncbi:TetR/AcrR family transcriptional regulator [Pseudoalteromonas sp. McH1-7]|uniref:TetR/AcrR family transcriptional regulator n=1 Tax=Pseudoalteromonas sp. McH1-7 TaxID=2745574 RepID=UPI0015902C4A|nr:TetR/AcrR family transcriptional regulator [Pseudoalteromonas sp. McH1-7]NUZ11058.1 TetR/AcrR family transcriptional regulator [Pseudoalteromonas sp. McH1-7]